MRAYTRAAQSYGSVQLVTGVASADNVQLIQMLFDGLAESLASARGHIENGNIVDKSNALSRASRIVVVCKARWILSAAVSWPTTSTSSTLT